MRIEVSGNEALLLEKYRDLLPEFQDALSEQLSVLSSLQTRIMKEAITDELGGEN